MIRLVVLFLLAAVACAIAAPPEGAPGPFADWYRSLRSPTSGISCCDESDCRPAAGMRMVRTGSDDDGLPVWNYEVLITPASHGAPEPMWVEVPRSKILTRDNPTGRPVVCWLPGPGVMCFVLPTLT